MLTFATVPLRVLVLSFAILFAGLGAFVKHRPAPYGLAMGQVIYNGLDVGVLDSDGNFIRWGASPILVERPVGELFLQRLRDEVGDVVHSNYSPVIQFEGAGSKTDARSSQIVRGEWTSSNMIVLDSYGADNFAAADSGTVNKGD
jgi:hypothetical protein